MKKISLVMIFIIFTLFYSCKKEVKKTDDINNSKTHIVQKGESLFSIATTYNLPVNKIRELNPNLKKDLSNWEIGFKLKIPIKTK